MLIRLGFPVYTLFDVGKAALIERMPRICQEPRVLTRPAKRLDPRAILAMSDMRPAWSSAMGQPHASEPDKAAMDLCWQVSGVPDRVTMLNAMATLLAELVPAETLVWNGLDMRAGWCEVHGILPSPDFGEEAGKVLVEVATDDPMVVTYLSETRSNLQAPRRMSDIVARTELMRTRTYNDLLHPFGAEYQMTALTARFDETAGRCWTFNRSDCDFTDTECDLATRIQPMLVALDQFWERTDETPAAVPLQREPDVGLTQREIEVLQCIAKGLTAAATARSLRIAEATVRKHLENCYRKLDRRDRLMAVDRARQLGVLDSTL